jgi:hypothetical protein
MAWAVSKQAKSGKNVSAFCRERGLRASQLFSWKKRFRGAGAAKILEVVVNPPPEATLALGARGSAIEVRPQRMPQSCCRTGLQRRPLSRVAGGIGERGMIGLPDLPYAHPQLCSWIRAAPISVGRSRNLQHATSPPLSHTVQPFQMLHHRSTTRRLHHFFESTSCSIILSSVRSATTLFSRWFSSCS